jgi:probable phosphoglycerate mutase
MWNVEKRLQGWKDSPLTDNGLRSAKRLAKRLQDIRLDRVFSSDQKRALTTAEIIAKDRNIPIEVLSSLRELNFGSWEGMTISEIETLYPLEYSTYKTDPDRYTSVGGENIEQLFDRVSKALETIGSCGEENVLVVTHGVTIRALMTIISGQGMDGFAKIPVFLGTSLTELELTDKGYRIIRAADADHL